jgi:hypothetical protein
VSRLGKGPLRAIKYTVIVRDSMISWPDELRRKVAEGIGNTEEGQATTVGLAMQLSQA